MTKKLLIMALLSVCFVFIFSGSASANQAVKEKIVKHALELGVDPALALSLAKIESNLNPALKSKHGAIGLFQLMPNTAAKLGVNPYYVSENIIGGLKYYQMMLQRYGTMELALAAYNAGPGNVARYNGIPPFTETKVFISRIKTEYHNSKNDPIIQEVKGKTLPPASVLTAADKQVIQNKVEIAAKSLADEKTADIQLIKAPIPSLGTHTKKSLTIEEFDS